MSWPPVDSADAAEQREIEQARQDAQRVEQVLHETACADGWLGEDAAGRLIPCLLCRPHLARGA